MNIRKIARWFGLKWSNRLEKLLPRFERDLLVLSNRTINNSQVAFDDKIHALDNIRQEFENPKYYEGLFKVYANFQLFSRMTDSLNEMVNKDLPISESMRDTVQEFALIRPVNPENEEAAKTLVLTFRKYSDYPIPLATESGESNLTLEAYIQLFKPYDVEDWIKLTGYLAVSEQYDILVQAYEYMKAEKMPLTSDVYDRALRSLIFLERGDDALAVVEEGVNNQKSLAQTQVLALSQILSPSKKHKLASLVDINRYSKPEPKLMQFVVKNQLTSDIQSTEAYDFIKKAETVPSATSTRNYGILLDALAGKNDIKAVENLWDEMLSKRLFPPMSSYNSLMDAYANAGDNQKVIEVWNTTFCKLPTNCQPHIITLLTSCINNGDLQTFKDQWKKVTAYDYRIEIGIYKVYLEGLVHFKQFEEAVEFFCKNLCRYALLPIESSLRDRLVALIKSAELPEDQMDSYMTRIRDAFLGYRKTKLSPKFQ